MSLCFLLSFDCKCNEKKLCSTTQNVKTFALFLEPDPYQGLRVRISPPLDLSWSPWERERVRSLYTAYHVQAPLDLDVTLTNVNEHSNWTSKNSSRRSFLFFFEYGQNTPMPCFSLREKQIKPHNKIHRLTKPSKTQTNLKSRQDFSFHR